MRRCQRRPPPPAAGVALRRPRWHPATRRPRVSKPGSSRTPYPLASEDAHPCAWSLPPHRAITSLLLTLPKYLTFLVTRSASLKWTIYGELLRIHKKRSSQNFY